MKAEMSVYSFNLIILSACVSAYPYLSRELSHNVKSYRALTRDTRSSRIRRTTIERQSCQPTCANMKQFLDRHCLPVKAPLCPNSSNAKKMEQFQCLSGCFSSGGLTNEAFQRPIFRVSSATKAERRILPDRSPVSQEDEDMISHPIPYIIATFDDANLTSSDKCRLEGLKGSLACQLEHEDPEKAERVFNEMLPQLFALYEKSFNEEMLTDYTLGNNGSLPTRQKRGATLSVNTSAENKKINRLNRAVHAKNPDDATNLRNKRTPASTYEQEMCQTAYQISRPFHALHFNSGERVSMYFYRGKNGSTRYVQMFEIGQCPSNTPVINMNLRGVVPRCKETKHKVLADLVIDLNEVNKTDFRACVNIDANRALCRDWIVLPTSCKLYFESA